MPAKAGIHLKGKGALWILNESSSIRVRGNDKFRQYQTADSLTNRSFIRILMHQFGPLAQLGERGAVAQGNVIRDLSQIRSLIDKNSSQGR